MNENGKDKSWLWYVFLGLVMVMFALGFFDKLVAFLTGLFF
jgi:hypothetical protein